ncbi:hypothetical protein EON65_46375 [archaeon]|nr:MAG: hypothetical protein EON65_46375 [archaeon]
MPLAFDRLFSDLGSRLIGFASLGNNKRDKKVHFNNNNDTMVLIPTRQEYKEAGCDLWYKFHMPGRRSLLPYTLKDDNNTDNDKENIAISKAGDFHDSSDTYIIQRAFPIRVSNRSLQYNTNNKRMRHLWRGHNLMSAV